MPGPNHRTAHKPRSEAKRRITVHLDSGHETNRRSSWLVGILTPPDFRLLGYLNAKTRAEALAKAKTKWPDQALDVWLKPDVL